MGFFMGKYINEIKIKRFELDFCGGKISEKQIRIQTLTPTYTLI